MKKVLEIKSKVEKISGKEDKFNTSQIWFEFLSKSDKKKVDILLSAIDYMGQFNGRTVYDCVALAMGYVMDINSDDIWYKEN